MKDLAIGLNLDTFRDYVKNASDESIQKLIDAGVGERCRPSRLREAKILAHDFTMAGIGFVPVPTMGDSDRAALLAITDARLALIDRVCEAAADDK